MDNTGENTALVPSTGTTARPSNTYHSLNNPRRIPDFDDGPTAQLQGMGQPISDQALRYEKAHTVTRRHWVVLLLACLLLFGNYYSYDTPAALNVQLREWLGTDYATHQFHLNLLYSVYSFPNIILPLLGGVLIDRLSVSLMLVIFSVLICVGTAIFAIGVSFKAIWVMILGRLVFGIGGECLEVAQAKITTDWFRNRWLGFALGLNLSSARIASALNDNISPWIARKSGLGVAGAAWVGFIICGFSLGCGCALAYLDRPESRTVAGVRLDARDREKLQDSNERIIGRQAINYSTDSAFTLSSEAMEEEVALENEQEMTEDDQMHWSEIFDLQTTFWILALCSVLLYGAVSSFLHISSDFLQKKWYPGNPTKAGAAMSIPDIVSSIGSPIGGYLLDRFGHRSRYISVSAIFLIVAHSLMGFTSLSPIPALIILGLGYSLFASAIWPCVPFLVQDHQLGTAYGIMTIILNSSLTFLPMIVATILKVTKGSYQHIEGLFIILSICGLCCSLYMNYLDHRQGEYSLVGEEPPLDDLPWGTSPRVSQDLTGRRYSRAFNDLRLTDEDEEDIPRDDSRVTTKAVGEGIITIIPHRRRNSMAGFTGHLERERLGRYARHIEETPHLNFIPGSLPEGLSPPYESRPEFR